MIISRLLSNHKIEVYRYLLVHPTIASQGGISSSHNVGNLASYWLRNHSCITV